MEAVKRRLELLKLEGLGFSQPEIVKELSQKFQCSGRTVYRDFECRDIWQPELQHLENHAGILMKVVNRYEQIYRQASIKLLTGTLEVTQLGALNVMLKALVIVPNEKTREVGALLAVARAEARKREHAYKNPPIRALKYLPELGVYVAVYEAYDVQLSRCGKKMKR